MPTLNWMKLHRACTSGGGNLAAILECCQLQIPSCTNTLDFHSLHFEKFWSGFLKALLMKHQESQAIK